MRLILVDTCQEIRNQYFLLPCYSIIEVKKWHVILYFHSGLLPKCFCLKCAISVIGNRFEVVNLSSDYCAVFGQFVCSEPLVKSN